MVRVQYSADGNAWVTLGAQNGGYNWYNKPTHYWSKENDTRWHVATINLPDSVSTIRFRFVMNSDEAVNREGFAFDDFHVYDNTGIIFDSVTHSSDLVQLISGNSWQHILENGEIIASVHPHNSNLGVTSVRAFIDTGSVRYANGQYYTGRNLVIRPSLRAPADSVSIRFYFMDHEVEKLLNANGCTLCSKPSSAYDLGVSKYSDADTSIENGSILDDQHGVWHFYSGSARKVIPYDRGYYAEFKVNDFSEFWLNSGGSDRNAPLPVKLMDFSVQKTTGDAVLVRWATGSEYNVDRFEIEVASGADAYQAGLFTKVGEVNSAGDHVTVLQYSFTDDFTDKFGVLYYRLKILDLDGSYYYSPVRSVNFDDVITWKVYPNPSPDVFNLVYMIGNGEVLNAAVYDAKGRRIRTYTQRGTGYYRKLQVDLTNEPTGIYLLRIYSGKDSRSFKLNKK
jgi:hypothetical protein